MNVSAPAQSASRARLLREIGLVRYRLRGPTAPVTPVRDWSAPVVAERHAASLRVYFEDGSTSAPTGDPGVVWAQVLAWLRLDADQVEWQPVPARDAVRLPAAQCWSSPDGKRELWLALKAWRTTRGSAGPD